MTVFFSTTPHPSSQEEGTTGSDFSSTIIIMTYPLRLFVLSSAIPQAAFSLSISRQSPVKQG